MAAITAFPSTGEGTLWYIRLGSAQANTGQTDWINVPAWAKACTIYLNWTAKAGTSPLIDFSIDEANPLLRDDSHVTPLDSWDGITQLSSEDLITIRVGPHRTSTDDTGVDYHVGTVLPSLMGLKMTLDRGTGDETYTYTLAVVWHR